MNNPRDRLLLALLAGTHDCGPVVAARLRSRYADRPLVEDWIERKLLRPEAARLLDWAGRGRIVLTDVRPLVTPRAVDWWAEERQAAAAPRAGETSPLSGLLRPLSVATMPVQIRPQTTEELARPAPRIGSQLGKCLLTDLLGRGGNGMVFRALHQGLNVSVAVKVLLPSIAHNPNAYRQLKSEARLLARLNHPRIVHVLDFEDDENYPYVVLEFVDGLSLAELIRQCGRVELPRALRIITQTAEALAAAAELGIVHRDIKPANILLTRGGDAKLADLGLAVVNARESPLHGQHPDAADDQTPAGTAAYMAPEQFTMPHAVDHRSDIYSLGATFYHAVTGQFPFPPKSFTALLLAHVQSMPRPVTDLVPGLPRALQTVLDKMLAKEPAHRYPDYESLIADLNGLDCQSMTATHPIIALPTPKSFRPLPMPAPPPPAAAAPTTTTRFILRDWFRRKDPPAPPSTSRSRP